MKSFLTIRGNLIFINLIVIALVLWLSISFLYIAVVQRVDARNLQANVQIERQIFQANSALALERDEFDTYFNSVISGTEIQNQYLLRLKTVGKNTDSKIDAFITEIKDSIDDFQFERMATTQPILSMQLKELDRNRTLLREHRSYSLSQRIPSADIDEHNTFSSLFESQTDTIDSLVDLARSLKYLPNNNASAISHYHSLLNEILAANVELAKEYTVWNKLSLEGHVTNLGNQLQIATQHRTLEQHFENIVSLAQASDNASLLLPLAVQSRDLYHQINYRAERNFHLLRGLDQRDDYVHDELKNVILSVLKLMEELGELTHLSMDTIAENYGKKSTRNLIIDIFLIFLCLAITIASVAINRKVKRYAYYDSLTQLPNRMNFESTLKNTSGSDSQIQAVIFMDLDRFKAINDNYGHSLGDELLKELAARLKSNCHPSHLIARMGGDEFAILISDAQSAAEVEAIAWQLLHAMKKTFMIQGLGLKVGASIGFCISPYDCNSGVELTKNADIAMYHSKAKKLEVPYRYNVQIASDHAQRLQLELDLKKGIDNDEFKLVYQPKVCTQTGKVKSVEALVRWLHPERGFVSPGDFIPVAEDTGLMGSIGHWVLNEACREISHLQKDNHSNLQVAVNISTQQFGDENFIDDVFSSLNTHGLNHECLELEVTESIVMSDIGRVVSILNTFKESGIAIAIDDFGTGYSSLQYLQELPLDTLKIDRAFIIALNDSDPANSVANSIVQLAKLFNLQTVAEGVETEDQNQNIRSLGVHHIQGYFYSKPVPASDLSATIKKIESQSVDSTQRAA